MKFFQYWLHMHWKQGEDFGSCLADTSTVSKALRLWGTRFLECQRFCEELAKRFEGKEIDAESSENCIFFYGDDAVLSVAAKEGLLTEMEFEDGESEEDEGLT